MIKKVLLGGIFFLNLSALTPYHRHFLSLTSQNDAYVHPMIDRYYTAGTSLLYASNEQKYGWLDSFGFIKGETSFSLGLSQLIYAPQEKFVSFPPKNDHPYAGLLSLTFGIHHRTENILESLGLKIGVSGEIALGREVQNGIHTMLGVGLANGWDSQIGNEVFVNLYYDWVYKHLIYESAYFDIEISPQLEFAFGSANIYGKFNTFLRMGYNLKNTFLPQGIIGENGGLQTGRVYADGIGFFVFAGIGGGYIMRKMSIDGNLFGRDSYLREINLCHWIGNLAAGASFVSGALSLTYMLFYTTKEFKEQNGGHTIGSISFAFSF